MSRVLTPAVIERAVYASFELDIRALKPGNVHQYAPGHDMSVADFLISAGQTAPILADPHLSVAGRILEGVRATRAAVGCNTNLGMLLLFAPLAAAAGLDHPGTLRERLKIILAGLDRRQAALVFEAIALAAPGGLGQAETYDVSGEAPDSLREAMCAAQHRDRIAWQYTHDYADVFGEALTTLRAGAQGNQRLEWALVACYLSFLTQFPDSHVARKYGEAVALRVMQQAQGIYNRFRKYDEPEEAAPLLLEFDHDLKIGGINPGTCADLAAACYLVHELEQLMGNED